MQRAEHAPGARLPSLTPSPPVAVAETDWKDYFAAPREGEHTVVGTLRALPGFASPQLGNERELLAYLPPSYHHDPDRRYPVLYMHDGQNLFDSATSFGDEWRVDETMEEFAGQGLEAIVIGVPNSGELRLEEYSPWADPRAGGGRGDDYIAFLVDTVKPAVDRDFRTLPGREHTGILGSSMGGLISLYGFFRRPDVFGITGVMSPALWFAERSVFAMIEDVVHTPGRIYVDVGTREGPRTLGDARRLRGLLVSRGYEIGRDLLYVEEKDAQHHEPAWGRRLRGALPFLLRDGA